jgi:hypothetical protein
MILSKFKTLFCLAVVLTLLFTPLVLQISQDGNAYALGSSGGGSNGGSGSRSDGAVSSAEPGTAHTPEPATLLLFGAGAAGLVIYLKSRKRK